VTETTNTTTNDVARDATGSAPAGTGSGDQPGSLMTLPAATQHAIDTQQRKNRFLRRRDVLLSILTPIAFLVLWEVAAATGLIDSRVFSAPTLIFQTAIEMIRDGSLFVHSWATIYRLVVGFIIGAAVGIGMGLLMGLWRPLRAAFGPMFTALYALPMIAILPLLLLVFGLTETPRILAVAISVFFVLQINTTAAVIQIDDGVLEAARSYNARGWRLFTSVLLPASLPTILTGMRVAAGMAVTVVTAVEFVAANEGLGFLIWNSWQLFQPSVMYVGLVAVAILGAVVTFGLVWLERVVTPWKYARNKKRKKING
jgi:NitT/TauT family transport system permease protein